mmetsp:Transcript_91940/g.205840  ORF Transcript_91940/g.205840 Transcript_91940/m.205840 type:complete len:257 (+) Transcript_91940:402-1172(+)
MSPAPRASASRTSRGTARGTTMPPRLALRSWRRPSPRCAGQANVTTRPSRHCSACSRRSPWRAGVSRGSSARSPPPTPGGWTPRPASTPEWRHCAWRWPAWLEREASWSLASTAARSRSTAEWSPSSRAGWRPGSLTASWSRAWAGCARSWRSDWTPSRGCAWRPSAWRASRSSWCSWRICRTASSRTSARPWRPCASRADRSSETRCRTPRSGSRLASGGAWRPCRRRLGRSSSCTSRSPRLAWVKTSSLCSSGW